MRALPDVNVLVALLEGLHLLALAVHRGGRRVTFDRGIALAAVPGAAKRHLVTLG